MPSEPPPSVLHTRLIRLAQAWALRAGFDPAIARELRRQAILANHAHYLESIPAYRRLAQEEGVTRLDDIEPIKQRLMLTDDVFKSYDQRWLDENDFGRMNRWLSEIHHRPVEADVAGLRSIDDWIERLGQAGLRLVYSSGTSGNFSFVPRDQENYRLFRLASTCYLAPLLLHEKVGALFQRLLIGPACRLLSPPTFARVSRQMGGLSGYDAVFLDFERGRTGNQTLEREMAPLFRKHYFLYETDLSPTILRLVARGAKTDEERERLSRLQHIVVGRKEQNYLSVIEHIRRSTADGQNMFIFGTTHQYKELCEVMAAHGDQLQLKQDSLVLFGGGWKSFAGERISRDQLLAMMSDSLGLPPARILEGYSMTEINAFMLRCDYGRFHIPPFIEPVILNPELTPIEGDDLRGVFGFLDPFAISYPGFIISGDEVHLVNDACPCGLVGPAVTEIGRARAREVKGCGGIMASVAA